MRTAIYVGLLFIGDCIKNLAISNKWVQDKESRILMGVLLVAFIVLDIIDVFKGW